VCAHAFAQHSSGGNSTPSDDGDDDDCYRDSVDNYGGDDSGDNDKDTDNDNDCSHHVSDDL
jgi:hypothetical protein